MLPSAALRSQSEAPDSTPKPFQLSLHVPVAVVGRGQSLSAQAGGGIEARARSLIEMESGVGGREAVMARIETNRILARADGNRQWELRANVALGILFLEDGGGTDAVVHFQEASRLAVQPLELIFCLYGAAKARLRVAPPDETLTECARALRLLRGSDGMLRARILRLAAEAYLESGDWMRGRRACDRARDIPGLSDIPEESACLRLVESDLLHATGRLDAAAIACREARETLSGSSSWHASICRRLGEICLGLAQFDEARAEAADGINRDPSRAEHGRLLAIAAKCDLESGDEEMAFKRLSAAEDLLRRAGAKRDLARILLFAGETRSMREARASSREAAREGVFEARSIFRSIGRADLVASCDGVLEMLRPRANGTPTAGNGVLALHPPRVPRARRLTQLGFLTSDPGILSSLDPLESLARTSMPVLILGESGTGKEVLARALHRAGGGRGPFVAVNCGALPTDLQESELFGHVRGAFTGAIADKIGLFEAADGGVLLLDEVGEMTPRAQVKLLRILELGEVRRVGETRTRRVQVRVVAATNADLLASLRLGTFRLDLYYRLCALRISIPPLRERLGDVPLLSQHFARLFTPSGESVPMISPEALDRLMGHTWPGNVRELRFTIERAIALTRALDRSRIESDCIAVEPTCEDVPPRSPSTASDVVAAGGLEAYIENTERRLILRALEENGWNRTRAARSLGDLSRTTLIGKMKRLGLFPDPSGVDGQEKQE